MNSTKTASQRPNPEGARGNLASINPFFIVKDLQASISHYIERFGFQLDFQGPDDDPYYGRVSRDGIDGGDVDVEGGVVLGDARPDLGDLGALPISEGRKIDSLERAGLDASHLGVGVRGVWKSPGFAIRVFSPPPIAVVAVEVQVER